MRILHVVPGAFNEANGCANAARLLIRKNPDSKLVEARDFVQGRIAGEWDEVWVHGTWTPWVWLASFRAIFQKQKLVRMVHGNLDPERLKTRTFRKLIVKPIELYLFRKASRTVVTGNWEKAWCRAWGVKGAFEIADLKAAFKLDTPMEEKTHNPIRVLYLGRNHPLKGLNYLEKAVSRLGDSVQLKTASSAFGEEKERLWAWCDVLCLPTLSENFGLVVAEALERGKRVVTTDGAPAWAPENGFEDEKLTYIKGFLAADDDLRIEKLEKALRKLCN